MLRSVSVRVRELLRAVREMVPARVADLLGPLRAVTSIGWFISASGLVAGVLGGALGWVEFRVIAGLVLLVLLVAIVFIARRPEIIGELRVHQQRVQIGDVIMGQVVIRSRARRGVLSQVVELPVGRNVARFFLPGLDSEEAHEELFKIDGKRRSVIPIGPVRAVQGDPLGLLRREKELTEQIEVFVHPEIVGITSGAMGFLKDIEGVATRHLSSSDVSFHALREYMPGDDRRAVHWRSTAKAGQLMVRQFEETMRVHLLVVLSLNPGDYASEEDFELAVSAAASIGVAALREERQITLWSTSGQIRYPSSVGVLDELSRVQLAEGMSLRDATADAVRSCPEASVVSLVTGGVTSIADVRAAEVSIPLEMARFGVRTSERHPIRRVVIGRMTLLDIARLTDLGPAMRSIR